MRLYAFIAAFAILQHALVSETRSIGRRNRWRRTAGFRWTCDKSIEGCLVHVSCSSSSELMVGTLECRIDNQVYNCIHTGPAQNGLGHSLNFTIDAHKDGVADGVQHDLSVRVRARYSGSSGITLRWPLQFTVQRDCPRSSESASQEPPTQSPTTVPEVVSCGYEFEAVFGNRVLVITCSSSSSDITRITYFINGIPIGIGVTNQVRVSSSQLRAGLNTIELTVQTSSGLSQTISLPVDTSQQPPTTQPLPTSAATTSPRPTTVATTQPTSPPTVALPTTLECLYKCRGILSYGAGLLTVTCDVDDETDGIISIQHSVNGGNSRNAGSGPSFSIPFSHFRNGANRVGVTVTHSQCGSGVMQLEFELEQLPTTPTVERCIYECGATLHTSELTVTCTVNGREERGSSIAYQLNRGALVNANSAPTFTLQTSDFQQGSNTLNITMSHPDCSQTGSLSLEIPYSRPPSTSDVSCTLGQQGSNIVFTCSSTSSLTITRISYYINGAPVGVSVGGVVQIAEHHFRDGINDVRLVVMKADGTTEEINFTINIEMQEPSGSTTQPITGLCLYNCTVRLQNEERQFAVTCTVNGQEDRGSSISYQINGGASVNATAPAFSIPTSGFRSGSNVLEISIVRSGCSAPGSLRLTLPPPPPPPPSLPVVCNISRHQGNVVFNCSSGSAAISSISAFVNGVPLASTIGRVLRISEQLLREGSNDVRLTIRRSDGTSQIVTYRVNIEREEVTLPPVVCGMNCSYELDGNAFVFECDVSGDSASILSISYSLNDQTPLVSTSRSFTIPQTEFVTGNNSLNLSVLTVCDGGIRTFQRQLQVTLHPTPPPNVTVPPILQAFRVRLSGISPYNYATLVPGFPIAINFTVDESGEYLVIRVTGTGSQRVLVLLYSLNGAPNSYEIGDTIRLHKDQLREGENTLTLTVVSILGQRILINSTLDVTKVTTQPHSICDVNCNATYEGNAVRMVCYGSSDIASLTYRINGGRNTTVQGSEWVIGGDLLTRELNDVQLLVNCQSGGVAVFHHRLVQPLSLRCQSASEEESGVRISCNSNRQSVVLTKQCYLDGTLLQECDMSNLLSYSTLSAGQHTFKMEVTDSNSFTASSQISFLFKFEITCQGIYNSIDDIIHVSCDSNRPIASSQLRVNNGALTQRSLPFDVDVSDYIASGAPTILLHVQAQDTYGNRDSSDLIFSC